MSNLSDQEKEKIKQLIDAGKPIPSVYRSKLFVKDDTEYIEATADYKLVYKGKARKEDIIANTPAAPLQKIRSFNSDNPHDDDWSNMLIFGDNLLALKSIYEDQRSENKLKTKNKIKLIYIDPPFATKHDFMKDKEKAYRDKVFGAKFLEFLRKRIILLREILADDGAIYIHLDLKKAHYVKVLLDEVFGEANFMNELIWLFSGREMTYTYYNNKHNNIFMYAKNRSQMAFNWEVIGEAPSKEVMGQYKHTDKDGRKYVIRNSSGSKGLKEEGPDTYR